MQANPTLQVYAQLMAGFSDHHGIDEVFKVIFPGQETNYVEAVGMGVTADELMLAHVEAFFQETLNPESPHFMFKSIGPHVRRYLNEFDIKPNGPDVMKYICAFAYELEKFAEKHGERLLVVRMIRLNAVRLLRNAAEMKHCQNASIPAQMMQKLYKVWSMEKQEELLGLYGTYMVFKTWSLAVLPQQAVGTVTPPAAAAAAAAAATALAPVVAAIPGPAVPGADADAVSPAASKPDAAQVA